MAPDRVCRDTLSAYCGYSLQESAQWLCSSTTQLREGHSGRPLHCWGWGGPYSPPYYYGGEGVFWHSRGAVCPLPTASCSTSCCKSEWASPNPPLKGVSPQHRAPCHPHPTLRASLSEPKTSPSFRRPIKLPISCCYCYLNL